MAKNCVSVSRFSAYDKFFFVYCSEKTSLEYIHLNNSHEMPRLILSEK